MSSRTFTVTLDEPFHDLETTIECATSAYAAESAMMQWVADMSVGVDQMPVDVVVAGGEHGLRRFRCVAPPAFVIGELQACRVCGCTDDRACDPPCAWVDDDLCDNPACIEAASKEAEAAHG